MRNTTLHRIVEVIRSLATLGTLTACTVLAFHPSLFGVWYSTTESTLHNVGVGGLTALGVIALMMNLRDGFFITWSIRAPWLLLYLPGVALGLLWSYGLWTKAPWMTIGIMSLDGFAFAGAIFTIMEMTVPGFFKRKVMKPEKPKAVA